MTFIVDGSVCIAILLNKRLTDEALIAETQCVLTNNTNHDTN
jgi:hypothetical protein